MAVVEERHDLVERFQEFYRTYYRDDIGELAQRYPSEQRSLYLDWDDLYQFDADIADDVIEQPEQVREHAQEALRLYDLPVDVDLAGAHVRVVGLDTVTDIRAIRSEHVNRLVSVTGIIRKATSVRPKMEEAAFECQRCGTLTRIPQTGTDFTEPHECEGCERQGPFSLNTDQSEFIDSQKLRVQESPEGLRGGETPESIDVHVEDDLCGAVTAGDHVQVTGVLRLEQQGSGNDASPIFDVYMEGDAVELEDEEFEDMDITEADLERIRELAADEDLYERLIDSIAPTIYGYREEKLAMLMQLFSGVTKHLPDESRIRGDLHMLLIGDPGTGKCVDGDTLVTLGDGRERPIRDVVNSNLDDPSPVDDGVYDDVDIRLPTMRPDGTITEGRATRVWKRDAPDRMVRIETASGKKLEVTPSHPLFVQSDGGPTAVRAAELDSGTFVATPRDIEVDGDDTLEAVPRRSASNNAVRIRLPEEWTPSLARLVGYVVAEGHVQSRDDNTANVTITNNDDEILDDVADALERLGLNFAIDGPRSGKSASRIRCASSEFASFLETVEPAILARSDGQRVPDAIHRATDRIKRAFLRAYVDAEGHVSSKQRELTVASMSRELLEGVRSLLLCLGIPSSIEPRSNRSYRLRISGPGFERYVESVGFVTDRKADQAERVDDATANPNLDVVPVDGEQLRRVRETIGLSQFDCGVPRTTYQHYERGDRSPSRASIEAVAEAFEARLSWLRRARRRIADGDWDEVEAARDELGISQRELAAGMGVEQTAVSYYERNDVVPDGGRIDGACEVVCDRIDEALEVTDAVSRLRERAESDLYWDRIVSIEHTEPEEEWVYDLEVAETHTYLSNNVVSHNSQLLQYVQNIAPRSVYTSGKGSSTAGLTAAAVKDDFGDGQQWSLEAGALVLADRGIAAVDELDKMAADDRSAMHEALEQQSVSISKAGINATLKSRCSLLGAANPKYGRFDQYEPIGEQIDLEPALISRFDLIFTVTDEPDEEEDRRLAEHILQSNYAGELTTQDRHLDVTDYSQADIDAATEDVDPDVDADLLRKYIAHARRTSYPSMTDEAREAIQQFYVDLRSQGADEDSAVPVTARKLEALVRLAEASARMRLADRVERADAERVIEIVRSCLNDIGVDPETGEFDADIVETGTSKSQRDRIKTLRALIEDMEDDYDYGVPVEDVMERTEEIEMDPDRVHHEIDQLKQKGELYEPQTDHLRTT